jgi:hypothetical protein
VLLALGSGVAQAQGVQGVGQSAQTGQSATSNATSTQTNPTNSNVSVRIFSPGSGGSVSQGNTSAAGSAALNAAKTAQGVSQSQSGGGEQAVGQEAATGQEANSNATSTQTKPTNSNIDVRIFSEGDNGDVKQDNTSVAESLTANAAKTEQGVEQSQGGGGKCCGGGGSGVQAVGQKAETGQEANSNATSTQDHPKNSNIPVRIGSPGDNGSVSQSNNSGAFSLAANLAKTEQGVSQTQGGGCGCGGDHVQAVGQKAITGQLADSNATSTQKGATNSNTPVRIKSPGNDGDVEQSNNSIALSAAVNAAATLQSVEQSQGCGCRPMKDGHGGGGGAGVQAVGQWAETWQGADSNATSEQFYPTNSNTPVRIKSPDAKKKAPAAKAAPGGSSVDQSNNSIAGSLALNLAATLQAVRQVQ